MNERLRELRKYMGLSQREMCAKIGMTQSTFASLETGAREFRDAYILLICKTFSAREEWLRHGNGTMFIEENRGLDELLIVFDKLTPALQGYVLEQAQSLLELQNRREL